MIDRLRALAHNSYFRAFIIGVLLFALGSSGMFIGHGEAFTSPLGFIAGIFFCILFFGAMFITPMAIAGKWITHPALWVALLVITGGLVGIATLWVSRKSLALWSFFRIRPIARRRVIYAVVGIALLTYQVMGQLTYHSYTGQYLPGVVLWWSNSHFSFNGDGSHNVIGFTAPIFGWRLMVNRPPWNHPTWSRQETPVTFFDNYGSVSAAELVDPNENCFYVQNVRQVEPEGGMVWNGDILVTYPSSGLIKMSGYDM